MEFLNFLDYLNIIWWMIAMIVVTCIHRCKITYHAFPKAVRMLISHYVKHKLTIQTCQVQAFLHSNICKHTVLGEIISLWLFQIIWMHKYNDWATQAYRTNWKGKQTLRNFPIFKRAKNICILGKCYHSKHQCNG